MQGNFAGEVTAEALMTKLSELLLSKRGERSLWELEQAFLKVDTSGSGKVIIEEFPGTLNSCGHFLPADEKNKIMRSFTSKVDRQEYFNYADFIAKLTVEPDSRRQNIIQKAWERLSDKGVALRSTMIKEYNAAKHPKVLATVKSEEAARREWTEMIDSFGADLDYPTFNRFFKQISSSCPYNADYFCVLVENTFGISELEGAVGKRIEEDYYNGLEQTLREKIEQKTRNSENADKTVKRMFKYFDPNGNGRVNRKDFARAIENFGLMMPDDQLNGFYLRYKDPSGDYVVYTTLAERVMKV